MNRRNLFKAAAVAAVAPVVPTAKAFPRHAGEAAAYVEPDHSGDHVHYMGNGSAAIGTLLVVPANQPIPEGWEVYRGHVHHMFVGRDEIVIQAKGVKRG